MSGADLARGNPASARDLYEAHSNMDDTPPWGLTGCAGMAGGLGEGTDSSLCLDVYGWVSQTILRTQFTIGGSGVPVPFSDG